MYCPKCAASNNEDTKFCRACGANLSLVPQALSGRLPDRASRRRHRRGFEHGGPANIADGIAKVFMGLGFMMVSAAVFFFAPAGKIWWFWMLLPAFGMLGKGIAEIVSSQQAQRTLPGATHNAAQAAPNTGELPARSSFETLPPPSVTETTTRHLDPSTDSYNRGR